MEYGIVQVPAAPVRRRPSHRKEMVNQLLFGETVCFLKKSRPNWVKVRSLLDGYEGWVTANMFLPVSAAIAKAKSIHVAAGLLNEISMNRQSMHIPAGSSLPNLEKKKGKLGDTPFTYKGKNLQTEATPATFAILESLAMQWLNAPYLWGGRTPLGVDCSGFMQVIFKMCGIILPRDTTQQVKEGKAIKKFSDAAPGDLVFFERGGEIVHVGMLLDKTHVIHSSGKVRIDGIDKKGIVDAETGKRTVALKAVRRVLDV